MSRSVSLLIDRLPADLRAGRRRHDLSPSRGLAVASLDRSDRSPSGTVAAVPTQTSPTPTETLTYTPITLLHATLAPGAELRLPWRADFNALVYVLAGSGSVGGERRPVRLGQLAAFGPGDVVTVAAAASQERRSPQLEVLLLGGLPIREPVAGSSPR